MQQSSTHKLGFTLIELLISISILALLTALVMSSLSVVRAKQKEAEARTQMQGMSLALSRYLADYGILGDQRVEKPTDFLNEPALFLIQRPLASDNDAYVSVKPNDLIDGNGRVVSINEAVGIMNVWRQPLQVQVTNAKSDPSQPFDHTTQIEIISSDGSAVEPLRLVFELDTDAWTWASED